MAERPPLSVVIPARDGLGELEDVFEALLPQAAQSGAEVIVVGGSQTSAPAGVTLISREDPNLLRLRRDGIFAATGEVIAIGEDHAVPHAGWCRAIIRAHEEHPEADAVVGALVNGTVDGIADRANFYAFASPVEAPIRELPRRPPPVSTLSVKRRAVERMPIDLGHFEAILVPAIFAEGRAVVGAGIVCDHLQRCTLPTMLRSGFDAARSSYGYLRDRQSGAERRHQALWAMRNWPRRTVAEARRFRSVGAVELAAVAGYGLAVGAGAAAGALAGPGRSPARMH